MSKQFEKWLVTQDNAIKKAVESIANRYDLKLDFKGYYFEDNNLVGSSEASPIYKSFKHYNEEVNDTQFINQARFFFKLSNSKESHVLTVRFFNNQVSPISFSIEDTYDESEVVDDGVTYGNLDPINDLITKKFKL